ncbi:MAG: hypothetical protein ACOCWH_06720, partial [Spirochaetota bacterium]
MKNKLVLTIIVGALSASFLGGGWIFKSDIASFLGDKANIAKDSAVEMALSQYPLPEAEKQKIREISRKIETKVLLGFLSDPNGFISGNTPEAKAFLESPEGKELMKLYTIHKG